MKATEDPPNNCERDSASHPRLVLRCDSCRHQQWSAATMDDPYPHVWCSKGHWEGAEPSGITEDPWKDCADFISHNTATMASEGLPSVQCSLPVGG